MPTHDESSAFRRDYKRLTPTQKSYLLKVLAQFVADLQDIEAGERDWFRPSLNVKRVRGIRGAYEMSWASDGRQRSHGVIQ
ncbi:MAG: hypothetical protein OXI96_03640 [Acidimicrobiaceae bacterium]|nr:hypothetical protein [Acidimicrobiaceae bacterium]